MAELVSCVQFIFMFHLTLILLTCKLKFDGNSICHRALRDYVLVLDRLICPQHFMLVGANIPPHKW